MDLIEWTDDLSIGHAEIDEQHREWINIINRLNKALVAGGEDQAFDQLFKGVLYYTNYHFSAEEALMEEHSYPDIENHKKLHAHFRDGILAHIQALIWGKQKDVSLVMDSLKHWLVNHIKKEDIELKKVLPSS